MRGSWAETYNKCVEPFVVRVESGSITFYNPGGRDSVETLISVAGNKVHTKSADDGSDNVYEVERDRIVASDSLGNKSIVVRCWDEAKPFDSVAACKEAIQKSGSDEKFLNGIRSRFKETGITPYVTLGHLEK